MIKLMNRISHVLIIITMQAMVHLLMSKYDIRYAAAVECHIQEILPGMK